MTEILYGGHREGKAEKEAIIEIAKDADRTHCHAAFVSVINQWNDPPEPVWVTKKGKRDEERKLLCGSTEEKEQILR